MSPEAPDDSQDCRYPAPYRGPHMLLNGWFWLAGAVCCVAWSAFWTAVAVASE